jgi:hypothetical protein
MEDNSAKIHSAQFETGTSTINMIHLKSDFNKSLDELVNEDAHQKRQKSNPKQMKKRDSNSRDQRHPV